MSLKEATKIYLEENPETTKPSFLKMMGDLFNTLKGGKNKAKKEDCDNDGKVEPKKGGKKGGFKGGEEKPEKKLNAYQTFMKEQMPLLQKRESEKGEGEQKKKPRELMTEISEMWKLKKAEA